MLATHQIAGTTDFDLSESLSICILAGSSEAASEAKRRDNDIAEIDAAFSNTTNAKVTPTFTVARHAHSRNTEI